MFLYSISEFILHNNNLEIGTMYTYVHIVCLKFYYKSLIVNERLVCLGYKKPLTVKWRHILCQHSLKHNLADDFQNLKVIVLKSVKLLLPMYKVSEKRKYVGEKLSHFEICYKRERALNIHILQNLSKIVNLEWKTMVVHIRTMCKIHVQTICSFFWTFYPQSGFKVHVNNVQWSWTKLNNGQGHTRRLWKKSQYFSLC